MVVGENKRNTNIMDGIENTGDVRLHDHRLRLKQRFDIVRKLGQGTYGKVQLGINKKTGQEVAIKTIKKCKIESEADLVRIRREVQIMSSVRHPNIVHIYEVFENSEKMILVMEYCSGGELYDYLSQKKVLQEDEARRLFRQIATAVYYCHIHKICHRDLKLENVLLDDTGSAKIADFGLSNVFKETSLLSTFCGSPLYASPEIVKGTPYIGPEVDCWSLGVLLYTLVYGAMPFDGSNFKRLVRQISNGDYYEPKTPSTASPLIRDMLTVDPLKRADIVYICDHPWVNAGCDTGCLEMAEALAAETPVRLDLLLSLAPAAVNNTNSVVVPAEQSQMNAEESNTDLTSFASDAIGPSSSAEKRILDLVAEGGEDAIKPSPTRTIVSAGDNKRKLELAMSASGLQRKKERVASCARIPSANSSEALPEELETPPPLPLDPPPDFTPPAELTVQPTLKSSATIIISPTAAEPEEIKAVPSDAAQDEPRDKPSGAKPRVTVKKKITPQRSEEKQMPEKLEDSKQEETKANEVATATDQLTSLSLAQPASNQTAHKPKKLSMPVVSKIAKPKAQSEDRDLPTKTSPQDNGTVRLQQIGIEPTLHPAEGMHAGGVKKTESEPTHGTPAVDSSVLLQDARRSLQNSMAKLVEERTGEDSRRRAARDIISTAIRSGKPPVPYGRSSSAGVASLASLASPPASSPGTPSAAGGPRIFRTEAQHRVEDHRNRGVSVERIIPIQVPEESPSTPPTPAPVAAPARFRDVTVPTPTVTPATSSTRANQVPLRRLVSSESGGSDACSSPGEPIKKSAREFIIPIAVEGKGYVTPRQGSLEPDAAASMGSRHRIARPRRISSLVSGGESEEEDDGHMHRLRSTRAARAESVSSGEEDEEDEGFHLLTAENLFSTLLHRVRALTNRLNGEEGPGFPQHSRSLFNNLQSPFFANSPHLSRRHNALREGWGSRDLHADFDSMFNKSRQPFPRGHNKKSSKHQTKATPNAEANVESGLDLSDLDLSSIQFSEKEMEALSGLTPALSKRLQRQLLAHLPPAAARSLRRTLSMQSTAPNRQKYVRSHSATKYVPADPKQDETVSPATDDKTDSAEPSPTTEQIPTETPTELPTLQPREQIPKQKAEDSPKYDDMDVPIPQFSTLPRLKRHSMRSREVTPPVVSTADLPVDNTRALNSPNKELSNSRCSSIRSTPDRPLLSKYLTPERVVSLDESFSSDSGSILSEPSYIAAYGTPTVSGATGLGFRRHSMRLSGEQPRKRISRFLRPDFYETPPDESVYAKHKKEKELETQKILREIREKKNKSVESPSSTRSPTESAEGPLLLKDDNSYTRKCLSPLSLLNGKERSRSTTPFFPILDNIKETTLDTSMKSVDKESLDKAPECKNKTDTDDSTRESKLIRPRSYPVKTLDSQERLSKDMSSNSTSGKENENNNKIIQKASKLTRPKSYPASSPSPEKVYVSKNVSQDDKGPALEHKEKVNADSNDVEVSFSISLPKKTKPPITQKAESLEKSDDTKVISSAADENNVLTLRKYNVVLISDTNNRCDSKEEKTGNGNISNGILAHETVNTANVDDSKINVMNHETKTEEVKLKPVESEIVEKKPTVKKKIIRKVSSKSKADVDSKLDISEAKAPVEKKKVVKKVKEKSSEETKPTTVTKKKSVLQSIGHKFEKFTSTKSSSPEKDKSSESKVKGSDSKNKVTESKNKESDIKDVKKEASEEIKTHRQETLAAHVNPPTESNLIKRAVTLTDADSLECSNSAPSKTAVSKVLGLFKKFEPKDKSPKVPVEKSPSDNIEARSDNSSKSDSISETIDNSDKDKPRRPTSLLLNGLGRKNKYGRSSSDSVSSSQKDDVELPAQRKESDTKRNSLKLDFSRLPRVKKIVPTNPVIEPQMVYTLDNDNEKKKQSESNGSIPDGTENNGSVELHSRSRSRSTSTFSNSDARDGTSTKPNDESTRTHPYRDHEATTPEKEDIVDRIRRKSFYTRFNEKKQRRKSNLVGPGAVEYDPVARLHSHAAEPKYDLSPTSPLSYDLSPGYSVASDLSPSTERYKSLMMERPLSPRSSLRYDNYALNDKVDSYRSLDRSEFRKYPGTRSYLDYDQPSSYGSHRYGRTMSLMDGSDANEDLGHIRDPQKYNRTISMYSPGNYATYRPKRTRNSAIILKESEKEPSPENILDKIRQRKTISISVTRKPDSEKDAQNRSNNSSKGQSDGAERSEKID